MGEALTPEEARKVDLSLNPVTRIRQIHEYAADMRPGVFVVGTFFNPNNPATRHALVMRAELHQEGKPLWRALDGLVECARIQQAGSVVIDARHRFANGRQ